MLGNLCQQSAAADADEIGARATMMQSEMTEMESIELYKVLENTIASFMTPGTYYIKLVPAACKVMFTFIYPCITSI